MATHVADRPISKIVPAMPFMRMNVVMKIAIRRRTDPFIPMQSGRNRLGWRPWTFAAVRAIGPAMRFGDFADDAGPNVFAELAITFFTVALVAHLRSDFRPGRHRAKSAGFRDVVADWFLAINIS